MKNLFSFSIAAALAFGVNAYADAPAAKPEMKPQQVRWLLAHEPADAFRRAAKTFAEQLKRETNGELELVVLTPKDVGSDHQQLSSEEVFSLLSQGKVELSQTVTTGIGEIEKKFWVLDLPFLFRNHEHAAKVLEGKVGKQLLASLEKDKVKGLAFTYSGGFRVVPALDREIRSVKDFSGLRVRTSSSPVAHETLKALGATPVPMTIEDSQEALAAAQVGAAETTYIRVKSVIGENSKYVNETYHSLFLTSILASEKFYKSLSKRNQEALNRAALNAARIERQDSVNDGVKVRADFEKSGVKVVKMNSANLNEFRKTMAPIYKKFEPMFGRELIEDIRRQ